MKLLYSKTSPYSRKVRLMIHEKGLNQAVTCIACNPFENVSDLEAGNPPGKVPTLILDDETSLYDSPVICEYLDTLPGRVSLAQLSLGASLGYLDFRLSDLGWRDQHSELTAWYEDFSSRDAMQNTQPE